MLPKYPSANVPDAPEVHHRAHVSFDIFCMSIEGKHGLQNQRTTIQRPQEGPVKGVVGERFSTMGEQKSSTSPSGENLGKIPDFPNLSHTLPDFPINAALITSE